MMAGSAGGGRITTFHYRDITGIEYNGGLVNGVLEILTPSYQGTANKDFWRGSGKNKNSDANDPWTLSNTLPLAKLVYQAALSRLNELRDKMTRAKQTTVVIAQPSAAGLADELKGLVALHQQGALTDDEFSAAKLAAISRNG